MIRAASCARWRHGLRLAAVGLLLAVAGCANLENQTENPAAPPSIPPEAPHTTGIETPASAEQKRLVTLFGGVYHAPAAETYVNAILARLAPATDRPNEPFHVTVLNTPLVNAFALPSGDIFVTRGLLGLANDTSELAAVLAHEIGHITAGHAAQRAELEKNTAVISRAASVIQNRQKGEEVQASGRLSLASFSRQQELEADQIGIRTIARAGYDPYAASRFLQSLGRSVALRAALFGQKSGEERLDITATHPSTPERIARALAMARQIGAPGIGETARDPYLAAIDHIDFGDDPSEGLIRGSRFIHPKLGFAFSAPDGFVLQNSAQAVLGVADGGAEALRLDSVRVSSTLALEDYLASGWIDGLDKASVETLTVNGLPAATATAKSNEWRFRVAAIRFGTEVYRVIFAARGLSAETDRGFRAAIGSFRRITSEEAADVKPLHILIVAAKTGDTAETLAQRMAVADRPLDTFLLLNGLDRTGGLTAGTHYKLVVE